MADVQEPLDVVLNVSEFYELVTTHLEAAFGRRHPRWVRGEISKVYEKGHLYVDVVESGTQSEQRRPVLNAHCWQSAWSSLRSRLRAEGVTLAAGVVVSFFGYVDVYAPSGRIGFTILDIDVEDLVGDLAKRRQILINRLDAEGLLRANGALDLPEVPLRIGLVASKGTEGYRDFLGQLSRSLIAFRVTHVQSLVQGDDAPEQLVRAISLLESADIDVMCIVRGGGSKSDLACFDDERVARAIATASVPILTGIGHTGDESVADLVAHTRAITPTQLGEDVVAKVMAWREQHVLDAAIRCHDALKDVLEEASAYVGERRRTVVLALRDRLRSEQRHLSTMRGRLDREREVNLSAARTYLAGRRRLLEAYDPHRRLAQGWSIVTGEDGKVVHSLSQVLLDERVRIRVGDGALDAVVQNKEAV